MITFFSSIRRRDYGNLEDPNVPISGQNLTAAQVFGGRNTTDSGVSVTPDTALEFSPIWCGIKKIAEGVSCLPLDCYKRLDARTVEIDTMHPAQLLMQYPNQIMVPQQFKALMMFHAILYGNFVCLIRRDRNAAPIELIPAAPWSVEVFRRGGEWWHKIWFNNLPVETPSINVFHIKQLSSDGIIGLPLVSYGRQVIGSGLALHRYTGSFFKNSGRPAAVLSHPNHLDEEAAKRLRESWDAMYAGSANAGKTAVLEEGMTLTPLGFKLSDMEARALASFDVLEASRLLCIPPHKLGHLEDSALRTVPEGNREFRDDTLAPWLKQIEEEAGRKLLTELEKDTRSHYFDFDEREILRMNPKDQAEIHQLQVQSLIKNPNECREEIGFNPYPGGDKYQNPNTKPGTPDGEQKPAEPADAGRAERELRHVRQLLVGEAARFIRRIGVRARKEAKFDQTFEAWFEDTLISEFRSQFVAALAPACGLAAHDRRGIASAAEAVDAVLVEIQNDFNQAYSTQTRDKFPAAVDTACTRHEQELADKLAQTILGDSHERSIAA